MIYNIDPNPGDDSPHTVRMMVEIPKNSGNKYEFDWELGLFRLSRTLYSPMHYPGNYGFIPGTEAEDQEPLDVLCLVTEPAFTGCLIYVRPVAMLDMLDGNETDHKVLAVPLQDPRFESIKGLSDIQEHAQREIEYFFQIYKELEGHAMVTRGWLEREQAYVTIQESRARYLSTQKLAAQPLTNQ